jgi:hypothetical protein
VGRYLAFTTSPSASRATLDPTHPAGSTHPHCLQTSHMLGGAFTSANAHIAADAIPTNPAMAAL